MVCSAGYRAGCFCCCSSSRNCFCENVSAVVLITLLNLTDKHLLILLGVQGLQELLPVVSCGHTARLLLEV
jgi:hypothetical protein